MPQTYESLLADIERLAPEIARRGAESEILGHLPLDLVDMLRTVGIFRMFAPRDHGGLELDFPQGMEVINALGRIDGSVGWTAVIGAGTALFMPLLSKEFYEYVYRNGPDVIFAGSANLSGAAESTEDGWRVTGRWPFTSGCLHADWILGVCTMNENGKPLPGPVEGTPLAKAFLLPASDWHIEDSWRVMGLKGTGSHHVALDNALVPSGQFFDLRGQPCVPGPLYGAVPQLVPLLHAANNLGMAEAALDDLLALAGTGHRQQRAATTMRDSEFVQMEAGRVHGELRAARALLNEQAADLWRHALAGTLNTNDRLIDSSLTATWITSTCIGVVDACFALGGSSVIFDSSPLQRRMRDLHTAGQHGTVHRRHYVAAGSALLDRKAN